MKLSPSIKIDNIRKIILIISTRLSVVKEKTTILKYAFEHDNAVYDFLSDLQDMLIYEIPS